MAVLQFSVLRAINVPVGDVRTSDPYVEVYQVFGEKEMKVAKTRAIENELNPVWNESFLLSGLRGMAFTLKLHDKDAGDHDDFLASVKFNGSSPLFPMDQDVTLRMKVEDKYKSKYKKGMECRLVVRLSVIESESGAKAAYFEKLSAVTLSTGGSVKLPIIPGRHYYTYLYYETEHAFDRMIPFKKPVQKTKDLEKEPIVLEAGYEVPPPPDFKSVPFIEQNCFAFDEKLKPVVECYGGEESDKGIKFSSWNPLLSPDGCICTGYRISAEKLAEKTDAVGFGVFLRAPLINWDEFKNIRFVIVDLNEQKKEVLTEKGKSKSVLETECTRAEPLACIQINPIPKAGGVLFSRITFNAGEMTIEAPEPVRPRAPEIPWISRSYSDIMPESVGFLLGEGACSDPAYPIKRKFLTYPKMSVDVQEESFVLTGTKQLKQFIVGLGWDSKEDLDVTLLTAERTPEGIVPGPTCDYTTANLFDGAIVHSGNRMSGSGMGDDEVISVNLEAIPEKISYLGVVISSQKDKDLSDVKNAYTRIALRDVEIVRSTLGKSKKKTAICTVLFYRGKDDPTQWGLLQVNHYIAADIPSSMCHAISIYIESLKANGLLP